MSVKSGDAIVIKKESTISRPSLCLICLSLPLLPTVTKGMLTHNLKYENALFTSDIEHTHLHMQVKVR